MENITRIHTKGTDVQRASSSNCETDRFVPDFTKELLMLSNSSVKERNVCRVVLVCEPCSSQDSSPHR